MENKERNFEEEEVIEDTKLYIRDYVLLLVELIGEEATKEYLKDLQY